MIIDCFNIYNEKEILHLRLDYLYDVVDRFVIVESLDSHSKKIRKTSYMFEDNIEIYKPYLDKIQYFKIDTLPFEGDTGVEADKWKNENYQKNYCSEGIKDVPDDSWILFSDVDEIPNKDIVKKLSSTCPNMVRFIQKLFYYNINVMQNQLWGGTVGIQKQNFKSMMHLRENRSSGNIYAYDNGGWHYSYMGGIDKVHQKMQSYAESNSNNNYCNLDNISKSIETTNDILGREEEMFKKTVVDINQKDMAPSNINKILELYPYLLKPPKVSYICLIYKSVSWLKFVYDQICRYTDLNSNEFFFVANDANDDVLDYLSNNNIPHYVHTNTQEQRQEWYINNVYRAYNYGGKKAKGEYIIFLNSDMAFSPNWSEILLNSITDNTCIASRLVERGILRSGTFGIENNFGNNYNDYRENDFLEYVKSISKKEIHDNGLYMPLLIKKEHLEKAGYYPEGNIVPGSDIFNPTYAKIGQDCIPGDITLMKKLGQIGIQHRTNFESIIYHFQQGEMSDVVTQIDKEGWLVNDRLTCIPNTTTFWHFLLNNINNLKDKTYTYTPFDQLAGRIEKDLLIHKPTYIIRNATYFPKINTDVYTISLLQDRHMNNNALFEMQKDVLKHSDMTVVNSKYMYNIYKDFIINKYKIIPLGTDFNRFKPSNNINNRVLPNSIVFIGSSLIYPKGFDRLQKIILDMPNQNFCLIMKDDFSVKQLPIECQKRVVVFNKVSQDDVISIINSCVMGICTSYEETQHLSGIEICACNKPMVATNVGFYYDCVDTSQWGLVADDSNFVDKIKYVLGNLDQFSPRNCLLDRGYDLETCKKAWFEIVKNITF